MTETVNGFSRRLMAAVLLTFCPSGFAAARTITLTTDDCAQLAVISEVQPRLGWACIQMGPGVYDIYNQVQLYPNMAILLRFPIDKIPKGQRITKAEFSFPVTYTAGTKQFLHVRRLLTEWGTGVCYDYRMMHPQKLPWAKAGGKGITSDRANKVSAVFNMEKAGLQTVDVTEDIELWYTKAVANHGWYMSLEDGGLIYMDAFYPNGANWKLTITYEPQ